MSYLTLPDKSGDLVYEIIVEYDQGTVHYASEVKVENWFNQNTAGFKPAGLFCIKLIFVIFKQSFLCLIFL